MSIDSLIVGVIILFSVGYVGYRLIYRKSCGCNCENGKGSCASYNGKKNKCCSQKPL